MRRHLLHMRLINSFIAIPLFSFTILSNCVALVLLYHITILKNA